MLLPGDAHAVGGRAQPAGDGDGEKVSGQNGRGEADIIKLFLLFREQILPTTVPITIMTIPVAYMTIPVTLMTIVVKLVMVSSAFAAVIMILSQNGAFHFFATQEIFQECRRLVVAEWQKIVYNEFLPIVVGSKLMSRFDLDSNPSLYNPAKKAAILTEFSTAAYRFGHSMIQNKVG